MILSEIQLGSEDLSTGLFPPRFAGHLRQLWDNIGKRVVALGWGTGMCPVGESNARAICYEAKT